MSVLTIDGKEYGWRGEFETNSTSRYIILKPEVVNA